MPSNSVYSVIILVFEQIGLPLCCHPILLLICMITGQIELHSVLLGITIIFILQIRSIFKMYVSAGSEASQKVEIVSCEVQNVAANKSSKFLIFYKIIFMINLHTIFYVFFKTSFYIFYTCLLWIVPFYWPED